MIDLMCDRCRELRKARRLTRTCQTFLHQTQLFLRANLIWFAWIAIWWVMFSGLLLKQERFVALWLPGWIMLAVAMASELAARSRWGRMAAGSLVSASVLLGAIGVAATSPSGIRGMEPVV